MRSSLLMLSLAALSACGDKDVSIDDSTDTEPEDDGVECVEDDDCNDWEICEDSVCEDGDRNNSADESITLAWDDGPSREHYINPAGDVDYFDISSPGGEYLRVRTITPEDEDGYDTIVTIRDPDQRILARVDNYPTGAVFTSSDSTIYAYLPVDGTYTIEVEDIGSVSDSDDLEAYGSRDYTYTIQVDTWGSGTSEDDASDDPSLEYEFTASDAGSYWPLGVALETEGDVDYVNFSFPYDNARFILYAQSDSYNDAVPLVRIYDADDNLVSEMSDITGGRDKYTPALSAGDYRMEITDVDGAGGTENWFFLYMSYGSEDTTYDAEVESNDTWSTATVLETTENTTESGGAYTASTAMGFADEKKKGVDEDWYQITAFDDGYLVSCMVSNYFSSTVAPTIALIDGDGETVLEEISGTDEYPTAVLENVEVSAGQTYYVRFTHADGGDTGLMAWYEFNVFVADFEIASYGCPP